MYNLSGIQKGIQSGHAAVEYSLRCNLGEKEYQDYYDFALNNKTFVILDGGSSRDMITRSMELSGFDIAQGCFYEPDLSNSLSAIAFILPENIYGIDLNDPGVEGDEEYAKRYAIKSYISQFKLASN